MHTAIHIKSFKKTALITAILVSLAVCVALALFQTRSVLTGNTISTTSADLLISTDGIHYGHTIPGFNFENIAPGGYPVPADGYPVYLKNAGNTVLDLALSMDAAPSNPGSADLSKLNVALTDASGSTIPRGFILQSLIGGTQPIEGELTPGSTRQYKLQALAAEDAAQGKTVGNIDLAFVGIARDPNELH
jgi:hypothetical protein